MTFLEYKEKLLKGIEEYLCENELTEDDAIKWVESMTNEDGSIGEYWSIEDTNRFKPEGIKPYCWYATLNMIHSDYSEVAKRYGVDRIEFYVDMAKTFLEDKDAKPNKLSEYYNHIVI